MKNGARGTRVGYLASEGMCVSGKAVAIWFCFRYE